MKKERMEKMNINPQMLKLARINPMDETLESLSKKMRGWWRQKTFPNLTIKRPSGIVQFGLTEKSKGYLCQKCEVEYEKLFCHMKDKEMTRLCESCVALENIGVSEKDYVEPSAIDYNELPEYIRKKYGGRTFEEVNPWCAAHL